jgi:hypothetical protein
MRNRRALAFARAGRRMMNITDPDQSFPRGKCMGTPTRPLPEAERFKCCPACGGYVDILDLAWVEDHDGPLPHPAQDGVQ